jgi:hypothetical protein
MLTARNSHAHVQVFLVHANACLFWQHIKPLCSRLGACKCLSVLAAQLTVCLAVL